MWWPEFPVPVGVLRRVNRPTHDQLVEAQIEDAAARQGQGDLQELLVSGETWVVD
jgi:2-oxoglutarate ferredoxin oxidoreductase subunit beta